MSEQQQIVKSPVAALDFNEHLRNAYYNAENSLVMFQTEGGTAIPAFPQGGSAFKAKVAWDKFVGQIRILISMVKGTPGLNDDEAFKRSLSPVIKIFTVKNPGYSPGNGKPATISREIMEDISDEQFALEVFTAITELFHRKGIFQPEASHYGGHL